MKIENVTWPRGLGRTAVAALLFAAASMEAAAVQDAQAARQLTLSDALIRALNNNPITNAADEEIRAAESEARQAGLWDNPTFVAEVEDFGGDREWFGDADTTLSINQTVPLGGDRSRARDAASAWAQAAHADHAVQRTRLLADTAQAYVAAHAASETLAVRLELLELANNSAAAINSRVEAGRVSPIERGRASVLVGRAAIAANEAASMQVEQHDRLAAIWSGERLYADFVSPLDAFDLSRSENAEVGVWIAENPELQKLRAVTRARAQEIRQERAAAIPDLTVGAGVRRFGGTDDSAFVATVEVPIPVLNRNQSGVRAAASRENAARLDEESTRRALLARFASASGRFERARSTHEQLSDNILPASENALAAAQEAYREGALDVLNFLDIQRSYFDVRVDLISAQSELVSALIELDALAGAPQLNRMVNASRGEEHND